MRIWRIARPVWPPLAGEGARRRGGRWNSPGNPVVYASERLSLAVLEVLVHVEADTVPPDLVSYEIDLPDDVPRETVNHHSLPAEWQDKPSHSASRALGDAWLMRADSVALLVPSAVVPGEVNVLLNPRHPGAAVITVVRALPFRFDLRLVRE